ncbi:MAG: hypothetical protein ACFE0S_10410 [Rhodospirillales bacterium]
MFLDPKTFEILAGRLSGDADAVRAATTGMPALPADDPKRPIPPERAQILLAFGLNERDLDFMGDKQRAMVDEVVDRVLAVQSLA